MSGLKIRRFGSRGCLRAQIAIAVQFSHIDKNLILDCYFFLGGGGGGVRQFGSRGCLRALGGKLS